VSEGGAAGLSLVGVPPNGRCISKCAGEWWMSCACWRLTSKGASNRGVCWGWCTSAVQALAHLYRSAD